ncbi:Uncharacterised protein [Mycobacteroides abscessus subsp. abscessus]|nr:Uncharacterised protein [Mycobacteroides abscessus subsp. abscessus]
MVPASRWVARMTPRMRSGPNCSTRTVPRIAQSGRETPIASDATPATSAVSATRAVVTRAWL